MNSKFIEPYSRLFFPDYADVDCGDLLPSMNGVGIVNETAFASEAKPLN